MEERQNYANAKISRGPYLQVVTPVSIIIRWRTDIPTPSTVFYGSSASELTGRKQIATVESEHIVKVDGLAPQRTYYYTVGTGTTVLWKSGNDPITSTFRTAVPSSYTGPIRMWALGDPGTGAIEQTKVMESYLALESEENKQTDWIMILGDNGYTNGDDIEYQTKLFNKYVSIFSYLPYYAVIGNHDMVRYREGGMNLPYFKSFTAPTNGEAGGVKSDSVKYYSYDYGNVHVAVLDSQTSDRSAGGVMATWLKADLQATNKQWIIVVFHHPPYTKGSHDSDTSSKLAEMRKNFGPICDEYGVDVVLAAHSHSYERSYLLKGHYDNSDKLAAGHFVDKKSGNPLTQGPYRKPPVRSANRGVVYVVMGCSGKVSGGKLNHPVMHKSINEPGSLAFDINDNVMDVRFITMYRTIGDHFQIVKGGSSNSPSKGRAYNQTMGE